MIARVVKGEEEATPDVNLEAEKVDIHAGMSQFKWMMKKSTRAWPSRMATAINSRLTKILSSVG